MTRHETKPDTCFILAKPGNNLQEALNKSIQDFSRRPVPDAALPPASMQTSLRWNDGGSYYERFVIAAKTRLPGCRRIFSGNDDGSYYKRLVIPAKAGTQ